MEITELALTRARVSRTAIEKLFIEMRHLVNRGAYKPWGWTGSVIRDALLSLSPEIYGSINDPDKVELDGLIYVIDRLPRGIERCRFVRLISDEGYENAGFEVMIPPARKRNCYRIDEEQMYIEVTRGRSEIYDILTHLTFLYIEAQKIKKNALDESGAPRREWQLLGQLVTHDLEMDETERNIAFTYVSKLTGRTFADVKSAYERLARNKGHNSGLFAVVHGLGHLAISEAQQDQYREISFSPALRARSGHHVYGERWATQIKSFLWERGLMDRPLHIISANPHSVLNSIYAFPALRETLGKNSSVGQIAQLLSDPESDALRKKVVAFALRNGMTVLDDHAGTHITVQIFDTGLIPWEQLSPELPADVQRLKAEKPVLLVMDYAFGEQAYETMDELLKPYELNGEKIPVQVASISIMGKAGILEGGKGDIMIPTAHVFEGTADNYPIENELCAADFEGAGLPVLEGTMITVLGTSLQNRDILSYFKNSSWRAIGLEMEGAHYQKAIQTHLHIRRTVQGPVALRYAYYASDNPLLTGHTLASGPLGGIGVKPTYLITLKILGKILG